jgi:energy-coupling factor transporter ATP-binding protein EcfA2
VSQELLVKFRILRSDRRKFTILDQISGTIHPNRICLMLGPPGSGKSTLLQALAGKLDSSDLKVSFLYILSSPFFPRGWCYEFTITHNLVRQAMNLTEILQATSHSKAHGARHYFPTAPTPHTRRLVSFRLALCYLQAEPSFNLIACECASCFHVSALGSVSRIPRKKIPSMLSNSLVPPTDQW